MVELEFKDKKIAIRPMKWGEYMDLQLERKKALDTNDEFALNIVLEKSLFGISGLTREDIKDWTIDEVYECIQKIRDASALPLK